MLHPGPRARLRHRGAGPRPDYRSGRNRGGTGRLRRRDRCRAAHPAAPRRAEQDRRPGRPRHGRPGPAGPRKTRLPGLRDLRRHRRGTAPAGLRHGRAGRGRPGRPPARAARRAEAGQGQGAGRRRARLRGGQARRQLPHHGREAAALGPADRLQQRRGRRLPGGPAGSPGRRGGPSRGGRRAGCRGPDRRPGRRRGVRLGSRRPHGQRCQRCPRIRPARPARPARHRPPAAPVTVPDTATAERADIATATRVVVKVGSSSLTTPDGEIDGMRIGALAAALSARRQDGGQVVLVSSGAIASGLAPLGLSKRPRDLATQQAAASVGQGLLIARYTAAFARHGIRTGQVLLSADDLMRRTHYRNAQRTLDRLLELGVLPVVNENDTVATDEIRFGDNDRLAALVAHVTRAGALILLSDVDGLYDGDPRRGEAQRITEVRDRADLYGIRLGRGLKAGQGTQGAGGTQGTQGNQDNRKAQGIGGMATKVEAAMIASAAGIPTVVADAASAATALGGGSAGTYFAAARGRRPATRLLWLKHAAVAHGSLRLDHGAVEAVVKRRASLLPAGITGVRSEERRVG